MGKVSIIKSNKDFRGELINAVELIGAVERFISHNDKIILKPNLNGVPHLTNIYTNKDLVESLIQLLFDYGVGKISLAESTFGDEKNTKVQFKKTGYLELAEKYDIELINLNASIAVDVPVRNPLVLESVSIAREILETDKIINLPNMKVHYATGISLSLKNMKGVLVRDREIPVA